MSIPGRAHDRTEAFARAKIDALLKDAGWDVTDRASILFEHTLPDGTRADYVLCDRAGRPIASLEAMHAGIGPVAAQDQGRHYAEQLQVPFAFLSSGEEVWFLDRGTDAHACGGSRASTRRTTWNAGLLPGGFVATVATSTAVATDRLPDRVHRHAVRPRAVNSGPSRADRETRRQVGILRRRGILPLAAGDRHGHGMCHVLEPTGGGANRQDALLP